MSNINVTNVDLGSVLIQPSVVSFNPDELTVPATTTYSEGLILARDSVSGKLIAFVKGGVTNENGIPKTVLTYDVENTTGAPVDTAVRVPVSAQVTKERLIIQADGDDTNVDQVVRDQLRDYGIDPINDKDLSILDNQ